MEICLTNAKTAGLGIHGISLEAHDDACTAGDRRNRCSSIDKISTERSKHGAYQNELEYLHTNVTNAAENAASSDSRIADANMAFEMTEFTKRNILMQPGQAMLVQSN